MQQTTNLELNKFDLSDNMKTTTRQGLNENADILDGAIGDLDDLTTTHKDNLVNAINDAAENGGIAVQDTQPTNDVLAWVDSDALGADFCFVGDTAPATDGTVAVWVDTSEDEIPVQSGAGGVSYDNTDSGLTADNVQGAIDEICGVEPFSLTYSSAITDLNIQGERCYYNPATKEVYISFCIYSAGARIPTMNNLIAEIPEEYRPTTAKTIGGMAFVCDNNSFTPYLESITPIDSVGKISLRNFIYGNKPTRVCSMNFNYVKD